MLQTHADRFGVIGNAGGFFFAVLTDVREVLAGRLPDPLNPAAGQLLLTRQFE